MSKKSSRHQKKIKQLTSRDMAEIMPEGLGVNFDLEENAEELFQQAVSEFAKGQKQIFKSDDLPPWPRSVKNRQKDGDQETVIDLHGLAVEQAKRTIDVRMTELMLGAAKGFELKVRIVTGKGLHSGPGGGVLIREIYAYVKSAYSKMIRKIDEPPAYATIGGQPLRGFFDVVFLVR